MRRGAELHNASPPDGGAFTEREDLGMRKPKVKIPCPKCGAMLDGKALAAALGAEFVKLRKTKTGGRHGGRPAIFDHSKPDCPCWRCGKKREKAARRSTAGGEVPKV
jgi:ribosomal protein S27E